MMLTDIHWDPLMPDEDKNFRGSLFLDLEFDDRWKQSIVW